MSPGQVDTEFFSSWTSTISYDLAGEHGDDGCQHWVTGGEIITITGPRVAEGRSQICERFLTDPVLAHAKWLFMIDSDMDWDADALCQLLGAAYSIDNQPKVIGGLCFAGGRSDRIYPTIYEAVTDPGSGDAVVQPVEDYPEDSLIKVGGTGAAFMLIHRGVLAHMFQDWPVGFRTIPAPTEDDPERVIMNPYPWFVEGVNGEHQFGEDIAFCQRARALGYGVYVHTGVETGHTKRFKLNAAEYRRRRAELAAASGTRAERRRAQREISR